MSMTKTSPPTTIAQLRDRARNSAHSREWFSKSTMRYWQTRVGFSVYVGESHTFFVTSERVAGERRYSVRACDATGEISTYGDFAEYATRDSAHRAAATAAATQTYTG
jgi:hypothetical protein